MVLKLVPEKTARGDAVTQKIEKDPAVRIQTIGAHKKKRQQRRGALEAR